MMHLFSDGKLAEYLGERKTDLITEIDSLDPDYLLKVSETDLQEHLVAKYSLELPRLVTNQIYQHEPEDVDIDVSRSRSHAILDRSQPSYIQGTSITISIPFEGSAELFRYQPSTFTYTPPRGRIVEREIQLTYQMPSQDPESLKSMYEGDLESIQKYTGWANRDVSAFNNFLAQVAQQGIGRRKQKILADRDMSAVLGIPIKRREDVPRTYAVPEIRRKPAIQRPRLTTEEPFRPEPTLADSEYENTLEIIQNMVAVMERSPQAFAEMGEEDLRWHFLVQLNGQYEGQATGETFNYTGKTDILIRVEGKNIFIAECKFWKKPKGLADTIDQLLGYTSWRDTKTAILLFNRDRHFNTVLAKIPEVAEFHPCFKRKITIEAETIFRYVFHQPDDSNRELLLTILAFDIPR